MPIRRSSAHQEAVDRRLALLTADLSVEPSTLPASADPWWHAEPADPEGREPAEAPDDAEVGAAVGAGQVMVAPPGRHAARRSWRRPAGAVVAGLVPDTLRGRAHLGAGPVAVLAVLVALGLAVTCWWVVRAAPEPSASPVPSLVAATTSGTPEAATAAPLTGVAVDDPSAVGTAGASSAVSAPGAGEVAGGTVTVDVAGRVRRPGIVVLDSGSRVVDAIDEAGGALPRVDLSTLNLARVLVDGEQILVGQATAAPAVPVTSTSGTTGIPTAPVNLNTATVEQLEALPEVGPVTAGAIVAWRDEHGGFTAVEELLEVDGIGDATLAQIAPFATV